MANPLLTGISGLRGHQKMLEVVGNNLANVNSTAFKSSRILFSDLMYETQRGASAGNGANSGSVNPIQVGTGSGLATVDRNFNQGVLEATGQDLDLAIDGNGFFVAQSGGQTLYTRSGSFKIDADGYLVDPSGALVQRFGTVGEPSASLSTPSFQTPGDDRIQIPLGASIPGAVTSQISLTGNLSADSTGLQAQVIRGRQFQVGGTAAALTDTLNSLDSTITPYALNDNIIVTGTNSGGDFTASIAVDATTTVGDLVTSLQALYTDATVSLVNGAIQLTDNNPGPSDLELTLSDEQGNIGATSSDLFGSDFDRIVTGADATVLTGTVSIYDERGSERTLSYELEKQTDGTWNLEAALDPSVGTLADNLIEGIRFDSTGAFAQVAGVGAGDANIEVLFNGSTTAQTITFSFDGSGSSGGLSETPGDAAPSADADGFGPGKLEAVQIDSNGTISGIASNGTSIPLAQLAIASFSNPNGLLGAGDGYYQSSLASGNPEIGAATAGDRGSIASGQLEGSNVDLALEFTRLIVAQRGFSANARTITVTDKVLEELTNIIR
jgi:flagellar hook protein FlgE